MDRVAVSAWVPLAALVVGSVEAARSPHLPADPASDVIVALGLELTGAAWLAVGVTGPSILSQIKRHKVRATGQTQVVLLPCLISLSRRFHNVVVARKVCTG